MPELVARVLPAEALCCPCSIPGMSFMSCMPSIFCWGMPDASRAATKPRAGNRRALKECSSSFVHFHFS